MKGLTAKQQEILGYLLLHMREEGTWPSFREIQSHFGYQSINAVMGHLKALEKKGYITRVPGQARTFRITADLSEDGLPPDAAEVVEMPVYGAIAAGYPDGVETGGAVGTLQVPRDWTAMRRTRRSFALRVRGDSMLDAGIEDGDSVIIEQRQPRDSDIVAALIDGETTLKRYIHQPGHAPYLKAENALYPSLHPVSELVIQGVATAFVRSLN